MHPLVRPLTLVLPLWLIACSSTPVATTAADGTAAAPASPAAAAATSDAAPSATARPDVAAAPLDPGAALGRERSVFFEFDDAIVRSEYAALVQSHGRYLQSRPATKIVVQGNTDERGGSEYNLALGQRRAEAVKAALRVYGVRDAQIEAVSFGEERPQADGHDEGAWRQNRRADIVYPR